MTIKTSERDTLQFPTPQRFAIAAIDKGFLQNPWLWIFDFIKRWFRNQNTWLIHITTLFRWNTKQILQRTISDAADNHPTGKLSCSRFSHRDWKLRSNNIHSSFKCSVNVATAQITFSCSLQFRFNLNSADVSSLQRSNWYRANDVNNPYRIVTTNLLLNTTTTVFESTLDPGSNLFTVVSGHVDVSGEQLLNTHIETFDDRIVGSVPLQDRCPNASIVYYHSPFTGTKAYEFDEPIEVSNDIVCGVLTQWSKL